jgi:lycopene cyclase domain-containing protein
MSYAWLSIGFVGVALLAGILLPLLDRRPGNPWPDARAVAITAAALLVLTAIFDNVMIGAGLFHYSPEHLTGLRIGLAPLEDFAYPLAAALLLPSLWTVLGRRHRTDAA